MKFRKEHGLEALNDIEAEDAHYTNQSGCIDVPTIDDKEDFDSTVASMAAVQIAPDHRTQILR